MKTFKRFLTIFFIVGTIYIGFSQKDTFASVFDNMFDVSIFSNNNSVYTETYDENGIYETNIVENVSGSYLFLQDGSFIRLQGIETISSKGEELLNVSLKNRKIWYYIDGVDSDGVNCAFVYVDTPSNKLDIYSSINLSLIAKGETTRGIISNGDYSNMVYYANTFSRNK